ncbi:amino acid transporter, partial [Streptomyces sp. NPDC086519]
MATTEHPPPSRLRTWMLEGLSDMGKSGGHTGPHAQPEPAHQGQRWWRVMCLTVVDYFSTIVLVIVTLAGALPVYRRVAEESPHGEAGLTVHGEVLHNRYRVLTLESASIPNALAALLLYVRDETGCIPHIYF